MNLSDRIIIIKVDVQAVYVTFNLLLNVVKGGQMGHCVMVSILCESWLTNTWFRFIVRHIWSYIKKYSLQTSEEVIFFIT